MSFYCDLGLRAEYCPTRIDPDWPQWFERKPEKTPREICVAELARELNLSYQGLRHYALKLLPDKSYVDYTDDDITNLRAHMQTVKIKRPMRRRKDAKNPKE